MWEIKMRGRPDGLFGVAQIMLCVNENSLAKVPATVVQYRFFFFPSGAVVAGKGMADNDHIRCISNVRCFTIRWMQKDSPSGGCCHRFDSFSLCPRSSHERSAAFLVYQLWISTTEARDIPWSTDKINLPPRCHQLREVIQAPAKTSALRHHHRNVKSQKVAVTEYWLCHRHTRAIPTHGHRSRSVSTTLKPYAVTLGPSGRDTTSDLGQNSTPPPLSSYVLQPFSFASRCTGWETRSVSISIIHPCTPVVRL